MYSTKTKIIVNIEDLPDGSHQSRCQCDHCGDYKNIEWRNFIKSTNKNNGKYYCCNVQRNSMVKTYLNLN